MIMKIRILGTEWERFYQHPKDPTTPLHVNFFTVLHSPFDIDDNRIPVYKTTFLRITESLAHSGATEWVERGLAGVLVLRYTQGVTRSGHIKKVPDESTRFFKTSPHHSLLDGYFLCLTRINVTKVKETCIKPP